jgi:AraC-like DNA-binding protein
MIDPVAQFIQLLKPNAPHPCRHLVGYGDWAIEFPPERRRAVFGIIAEGTCWFDHPATVPRQLNKGDFILLTEPPAWRLRSGDRVAGTDFRSSYESSPDQVVTFGEPGDGRSTRLVGGYFDFDPTNAGLLAQLLPPIIVVGSSEAEAWRLRSIVDLINDEIRVVRQGHELVVSRLLDLLLLESLRLRSDEVAMTRVGMLAGLADHQLSGAIHALHADVRHPWTVDSLAKRAGMSRSAFAASFRRCVGKSPAEYLLHWRMALAKDALRHTDDGLATVAAASGYGSTAAFNTAFRRVVGQPPGAYAANTRALASRR